MSTKQQIDKNLELSEKLLDYLAANPRKGASKSVSYVAFSKQDTELNKANLTLIESLKKEGKHIIKAFETKDKSNPWQFTPVSA